MTLAIGLVGLATGLAGCTTAAAGGGAHQAAAPGTTTHSLPRAGSTNDPGPPTRPSTTVAPPPTTTTSPAQPGWNPVATTATGVAVDLQSYTAPDGTTVSLARFRSGQVHYALHPGSSDPPGAASLPGVPGPAITPQEEPALLAAFNGGFKQGAGPQGFEIDGQVVEPLQSGLASLVIYSDGTAQVGIWGQSVPKPGAQVQSVRQNLSPLVQGGQPSPQITDIAAWGATLGGGSAVARSAIGMDAGGNLIYAASMDALPSDLAAALIQAGAQTAMELDINPEWVQLAVASAPGGPLAAGVPGQNRPADQYQVGWTRDFVTVLYSPSQG